MAFELLEKYRQWIWNCQACSTCFRGPHNPFRPLGPTPDRICPEYEKYKSLWHSCMGRIQDIKWLMEGNLEITDEFVDCVYDCLMCGACGPERMGLPSCVVARQQVPIFRALRTEIVKQKKGPPEPFKKVGAAIEKEGNRFGAKVEKSKWIPEGMDIPTKGDLVYFAGCVASYRSNQIAQSTAKLLNHTETSFAVLGDDEWCCGNPLYDTGMMDAFEFVVKHNVSALRDAGAKRVVTSCACCYNVLKLRYPEVLGDLGFEVVHSIELLSELLERGKINPARILKERITYQDPCHLARLGTSWNALTEEPRKLLKSIVAGDFVEMEGNQGDTQCCGRYVAELPEGSLSAGTSRIRDAKAVDASTVVTSCSFCNWSLNRAAKEMNVDIKVQDITEIMVQALGL